MQFEESVCAESEDEAKSVAREKFIVNHRVSIRDRDGRFITPAGPDEPEPWSNVESVDVESRVIPLWSLVYWVRLNDCETQTNVFFSETREGCIEKAMLLLDTWVKAYEEKDSTGASVGVACPFAGEKRSAMEVLADMGSVRDSLENFDPCEDRWCWFPGGPSGWDYNHFGFKLAPVFAGASWTAAED